MSIGNFIRYYLISMRLHFGFITGIGGYLGVSYYEYLFGPMEVSKKIFALLVLFLSYGINQIINDYTGLEEDRINAPNRPMVSGKLAAKPALYTSIILMSLVGVITLFIAPYALLPVLGGVLLNYLYEYAKSYSVIGNIFFGLSMMSCPVYGFLIGGSIEWNKIHWSAVIITLLLLSYTTGLMTYYTYFKDYLGDKKTGKKTYIVRHGVDKSKKDGIIYSILPLFILTILIATNTFPHLIVFNRHFLLLIVITFILQLWTALLYYRNPNPPLAFFQQRENIQACVQSLIIPIALYNGDLSLILSLVSYIGIEIIFNLHRDELS